MKRRVVVTGLGVVSPIGIGKEKFWKSLISGECGVDYVTRFDASSYPCKLAAEVKDFIPSDFMSPKVARRLSRSSQFAIVATQKALEDAKLELSKEDPKQLGVCCGSSMGPMDVQEKFFAAIYERGLKRVSPLFEGMLNPNGMVGALAELFNIRGYNLTVSTGCCGGNMAICHGYHAVASGFADILVAGGADTPIYPLTYGIYAASGVMAANNGGPPKKAMCPYDKRRSGYVFGEGAGFLILEEMEHALRRGARIYAEILGFGLTNDALDTRTFSPSTEGIIRAFQLALSRSSLRPEEVDYICGHAHSSIVTDTKETETIKAVFGSHAYKMAISSIKASIGHSMAGATAMQGIATCLSIYEGTLPPTLNYEVPDPELDLDYVPKSRRREIRIAMANSFGLGGTNVVSVYKKI
jgi:3-oxoacyl-[acyl-carrier-protein] synthase II